MTNLEIANLLNSVSAAYKFKGEEKNRFRIIAYERAADAVEHLSSEAKDLWDEGKLEEISGIGKSIASYLDEIFRTGKSKHFEKVIKGLPPAMFELLKIPGIGPKTAYKLSKSLGITKEHGALKKLEQAIDKGKVAEIEGFGKQSEKDIKKSLERFKSQKKRLLLPYAQQIANEIIEWLLENENVKRADPLGSLRRKASTVGDVDIAVATDNPSRVLEHFTNYPKSKRVIEKGEHTASILLPPNVQVDLMVQNPKSFGSLLQHFTGSKHHNIALREYANKKGYSLSEYGIKVVASNKQHVTRIFKDEEEFYKALGMEWIPPELREDTGEIELALDNKLPKLVDLGDIKADLQIHSDFNIETSHDLGESSMEEIVNKAGILGYEYIAFTEHNPSKSRHSQNQIIDLLKRKKEKIEQLNASLRTSHTNGISFRSLSNKRQVKKVFNSLEIDILPDGKLPVPEKGLDLLDFALVSIHSSFKLPKNDMTKRVIEAMKHPKVKIFAHPTARKLNEREGVELDWSQIFDFCVKNNKWLEINADPQRLDLPDFLVKEAVKYGVKMTLGTDAHHVNHMDNLKYAVFVARRGWAEKKNIVNCLPLIEFKKMVE